MQNKGRWGHYGWKETEVNMFWGRCVQWTEKRPAQPGQVSGHGENNTNWVETGRQGPLAKIRRWNCIFSVIGSHWNFFFNFLIYFIYGCVGSSFLCEGFLQLWQAGATLHRDARASHYRGLSLSRPLLLRSTGSRRAGSVVVAHGPSCSAACGILPDQGSNPCPLHRQADSQPLRHQGSPATGIF